VEIACKQAPTRGTALMERRYRILFWIKAMRTLMHCSHFHSLMLAAMGKPANWPGRPETYSTAR